LLHRLLLHLRSFSYCALLGCSILGRMDAIDVPAAVRFVVACKNFDGGFGCTPGAH
jgi:geranylgeranyl transferase type-2 subunit beta